MNIVLIIGFFFLTSLALTWLFLKAANWLGFVDVPNERSSHSVIKPRGAGVIIAILGVLASMLSLKLNYIDSKVALVVIASFAVIGLIGLLDDKLSLSAKTRAAVHVAVGVFCLLVLGRFTNIDFGIFVLNLSIIGEVIAILMLVWSTNLFNFMDGTDGIAAVEAITVLAMSGIFLLLQHHAGDFSYFLLIIASIIGGFLFWNWPNSRVFMGDVGSGSLGFVIMLLGIIAKIKFHVPILVWLILYGAFIFDATITLVRRVLYKERWFEAHREHAYQRMVRMGFSHASVLIIWIGINLILSAIAYWAFIDQSMLLYAFILATIFLASGYFLLEKRFPMFASKQFEQQLRSSTNYSILPAKEDLKHGYADNKEV